MIYGKFILTVCVQDFKKTLACEELKPKSMLFKRENVGNLCNKLMLNSIFFPLKGEYFESVSVCEGEQVG